MKTGAYVVLLIAAAAAVLFLVEENAFRTAPNQTTTMANPSNMKLSSSAFEPGGSIPPQYTCDGDNKHLPLDFSGVPGEAKSLALIMDDPDVPKDLKPDGVFDHWVVFNIPPKTAGVKEIDAAVPGTYGANSSGQNAYAGPCPPDREHRYFIRLYALDTQLALKKGATKAEVLEAMDGHILSTAELMGRYERPKGAQ